MVKSLLDPYYYMVDPAIKPCAFDRRVDLLAPDTVQVADGKYLIASISAPKNNVIIVKAIIPYAQARTDVGDPDEDFEMISPQAANGHFLYEPQINGSAPVLVSIDYNNPRVAGGTLNNNDRTQGNGYSMISDEPMKDAQVAWQNPLFSFAIASDQTLQVIFSILPMGTTSPMPDPYTIAVGATRRVDFAGVIVAGVQIPAQRFKEFQKQLGDA